MPSLRGQRQAEHYRIGIGQNFPQLTGTHDARNARHAARVTAHTADPHPEGSGDCRDAATDLTEPDDTQLFTCDRFSRIAAPLATCLLPKSTRQVAEQRQQQCHDVVTHQICVSAAAVGDFDLRAQAERRKKRVDAGACDVQQPQAASRAPVDARRATDDEVFYVPQLFQELTGVHQMRREPMTSQIVNYASLSIGAHLQRNVDLRVRHERESSPRTWPRCTTKKASGLGGEERAASICLRYLDLVVNSLPRRGYVGLRVAPVPETAPPGPGLHVSDVQHGSPAHRAGAEVGDRLIAIGDTPVPDMATARRLLRELASLQTLHFAVQRNGETLQLRGDIRPMPVEQHTAGTIHLDEVAVGPYRLRTIALVPDSPGPHPTLLYLPGAHWASEEYPFDVEQPVPALLGHLAKHGIASLRVDRFGMGDSEGPPCNAVDFEREFAGYRIGLESLSRAHWCDPRRIVLCGHSLGAMVAPLLVSQWPAALGLSGIVAFGASAIPIVDGLTDALRRYGSRQTHVSPETIERQIELLRLIVEGGRTPIEAVRERPHLGAVTPDHFTDTSIYRRNVAFYHQLQRQPVAEAWSRVRAPAVALHGEKDWICSFEDSVRIAGLVTNGVAIRVPNTDHHLSSNGATFLRDPHTRPTSLQLSPELASVLTARVLQLISD